MTLTKPNTEPPTTYLTARTKSGKGSKTLTVYDVTPDQLIHDVRRFIEARARRRSVKRTPLSTAS